MSSPAPALRPARVALLFLGLLAVASVPFVENHVAIIAWSGGSNDGATLDEGDGESRSEASVPLSSLDRQLKQQPQPQPAEASQEGHPPNPDPRQFRRRLASRKPLMDEATQQKQMKSYLGGLYPPVDKDMMPLYLKDVKDETDTKILDMYHSSGEPVMKDRDLVYFWHVPKASGSTVKNIMNFCFDLRRAEKLQEPATMAYARNNILNMDTSTPDGLSFSFSNQIVSSGKLDLVVSNYFLSGSALFNDQHMGKTFTIMRHPVDLSLSLFHYRRKATWERAYRKDWMNLSYFDYVSSEDYMDNWMVRQLTGTMPWVELNESHLDRAKNLLKRKIFVGIMSEMGETIRQLKAHYGWVEKEQGCARKYLDEGTNTNAHPKLQGGRGGKTWNVVVEKEKWDMGLYHYALQLFAEQRTRYPPPEQPQPQG